MVGPFEQHVTYVALHGPEGEQVFERGRNYQDTDHIRRWITIQGLDWIRRMVLGEMESPVDWN